jgi:hypothetical protein
LFLEVERRKKNGRKKQENIIIGGILNTNQNMLNIEERIELKKDKDEIIYLNVAGESFATLMSTIEQVKGTKLYDMLTV